MYMSTTFRKLHTCDYSYNVIAMVMYDCACSFSGSRLKKITVMHIYHNQWLLYNYFSVSCIKYYCQLSQPSGRYYQRD